MGSEGSISYGYGFFDSTCFMVRLPPAIVYPESLRYVPLRMTRFLGSCGWNSKGLRAAKRRPYGIYRWCGEKASPKGSPQRRMAFVGRGEAKAQVEFSACGKWNIVACASTRSEGFSESPSTPQSEIKDFRQLPSKGSHWRIEFGKKKKARCISNTLFPSSFLNYRAALAFSTRAAKAAASWIAISDRLLRFISMPAFFTPFMNLE